MTFQLHNIAKREVVLIAVSNQQLAVSSFGFIFTAKTNLQ
jgi:hypothetical protein